MKKITFYNTVDDFNIGKSPGLSCPYNIFKAAKLSEMPCIIGNAETEDCKECWNTWKHLIKVEEMNGDKNDC